MGLFSTGASFASIVRNIVSLINLTVGVLAALAVVVFFIGLVRYIRESGDAKGHAEGRERIVWSLVALFVLFSIWGILQLMSLAFFGTSGTSAVTGSTQVPQNLSGSAQYQALPQNPPTPPVRPAGF